MFFRLIGKLWVEYNFYYISKRVNFAIILCLATTFNFMVRLNLSISILTMVELNVNDENGTIIELPNVNTFCFCF